MDMWYVGVGGVLDLIVEIFGKAVRGVSCPVECREVERWCYD